MKITLELDNLTGLVEQTLNNNLKNVVRQEVDALIKESIQQSKDEIKALISEKMLKYVDDYITTATISVGGGWTEEPKTYTIEEYIKSEIADRIENGKFLLKNNYSTDTYKSFSDYIEEKFDVDTKIKNKLENFIKGVQKDIDSNISEMFNQTTQKALSSSIINLLMQNDTFLNMQESVKRISSRE